MPRSAHSAPSALSAPSDSAPASAAPAESNVKSAERALRLLEVLAASPTKLSVADLQAATAYPRSSLHVLVRTLLQMDWIEPDATGSRYGIGAQALLSGTAYIDRDPALPIATRVIEQLRDEIGQTVHYARRVGDSVIYLASRESLVRVRDIYRVGRKLPAHLTALGQALLAELTAEEVDAVLPPTLTGRMPASITDRATLGAELDRVRQRGWAWEVEQGTPELGCVAAPVPYRIPATDAISCSMPVEMARDEAQVTQVAEVVVDHAQRLATLLRREGIR